MIKKNHTTFWVVATIGGMTLNRLMDISIMMNGKTNAMKGTLIKQFQR